MGEVHRRKILEHIPKGGRYLEWGSGGTTLWLAQNIPEGAELVSIEHHPDWADRVENELKRYKNCRIIKKPGKAGANATFAEEDPTYLSDYIHAADDLGEFDCILVDGVARSWCAIQAKKLLKNTGTIFIHDAQRPWYDPAKELFTTCDELLSCDDYPGPNLWYGVKRSDKNRNLLLWVMNVCWMGGTALWVLDTIKTLSGWKHEVIFLNGEEDKSISDQFKALGIRVSKAGGITRDLMQAINPSSVILSNTSPTKIEDFPNTKWLTDNYYTIYYHHSAVHPWLSESDIDIFNSEYLKNQYRNLFERMRQIFVIPPGVEPEDLIKIKRYKKEKERLVIGRHSSDLPDKYPKEQIDILKEVGHPAIILGGEKYYDQEVLKQDNITVLPVGAMEVPRFLASIDIFTYRTAPSVKETWGRILTEAMLAGLPAVVEDCGGLSEQIEHGVDGFLCKNDDQFVRYLTMLVTDHELRYEMGQKAREKALQNFTNMEFKKNIEPFLVKNAIG